MKTKQLYLTIVLLTLLTNIQAQTVRLDSLVFGNKTDTTRSFVTFTLYQSDKDLTTYDSIENSSMSTLIVDSQKKWDIHYWWTMNNEMTYLIGENLEKKGEKQIYQIEKIGNFWYNVKGTNIKVKILPEVCLIVFYHKEKGMYLSYDLDVRKALYFLSKSRELYGDEN
jgi:hypothetical protein